MLRKTENRVTALKVCYYPKILITQKIMVWITDFESPDVKFTLKNKGISYMTVMAGDEIMNNPLISLI